MKNTLQAFITCRFPAWGDNKEYPAFGIKYLIEVQIEEIEKIEEIFKEKYEKVIGKKFDGEILFVEETEVVNLIKIAEVDRLLDNK